MFTKKTMKSIIILLLVFMMLFPLEAFAEEPDLSGMTDEELHDLIDRARNELTKREMKAEENLVLFEQDDVSVYLTGRYKIWGSDTVYMDLELVVINDRGEDIGMGFDSTVINGWDVWSTGVSGITGNHKKKEEISLNLSDADISSFEEIEDISFGFYIYDASTYKRISTIEPVTVHFN